jgi:ATP-dependent RNA helicase DDX27
MRVAQIAELLRLCPVRRQTLLFSATLTPAVEQLAALSLQQPARLSADGIGAAPATLTQEIVRVRPAAAGDKEAIVMTLLSRTFANQRVIVFARTKARAHRMKVIAGLVGLPAAELHGDMTQAQRLASLETFRTGEAQLLIATDVAARGLDIAAVNAVVSLDAPRDTAAYLHRCGRTARAGAAGTSVTLAEEKDRPLLKALAAAAKEGGAGSGVGALRERRVDPAAIAAWRERLEGLADALEHVAELEKEEAVHRRADMEAAKAEHLLEHAEDIASRPARSWFQSEHEKLRAAKVARAAATKPASAAKAAPGKKKKRDEEGGADADARPGKKGRNARDGDGAGDGDEPKPRARDDPLAIARRGAALAKGAAKRALAAGLRPSAAKEAGRQALRKDAKLARRKMMKEGGPAKAADGGPGGLFAGDGINGSRPGRDAPRSSAPRIDMKVAGAPRPLRDGGVRKKSGFKSKKRFKRR